MNFMHQTNRIGQDLHQTCNAGNDIEHVHMLCADLVWKYNRQQSLIQIKVKRDGVPTMASYGNKSFAQLSLNIQDKADFTKWAQTNPQPVDELIVELTGEGYKISITYVIDSQSFCVSLIGTDLCTVNKDMVMTAWAADPLEAMYLIAYKHIVKCNRDRWPSNDTGARWG